MRDEPGVKLAGSVFDLLQAHCPLGKTKLSTFIFDNRTVSSQSLQSQRQYVSSRLYVFKSELMNCLSCRKPDAETTGPMHLVRNRNRNRNSPTSTYLKLEPGPRPYISYGFASLPSIYCISMPLRRKDRPRICRDPIHTILLTANCKGTIGPPFLFLFVIRCNQEQ